MEKVLIVSATNDNNLVLANNLQNILSELGFPADVVSLEDLKLPLFSSEAIIKEDHIQT